MRVPAILCLGFLAAACQTIPLSDNYIRSSDFAERGERREAQPAAYWCYRTIGRPECSKTPLPGQEHRLIEGGLQPAAPPPYPMPPAKPAQKASAGAAADGSSTAEAPPKQSFLDRTVNFFDL